MMVDRLFSSLSDACREVDPNHLNLGARYYSVPPAWALAGMMAFDVFSVNNYSERVHAAQLAPVSARLDRPVLVGEWHFGALDVGLPASGIGRVNDQAARAQAFRVYTEDAAAQPWCVGVHHFTLYDQSALGRFDGENYNIGFIDTCGRPYEPLAAAARRSHERLYGVASGGTRALRRPSCLPAQALLMLRSLQVKASRALKVGGATMTDRPNFLLILADQWRARLLVVAGSPGGRNTLFSTNLPDEGVGFTSAYSPRSGLHPCPRLTYHRTDALVTWTARLPRRCALALPPYADALLA